MYPEVPPNPTKSHQVSSVPWCQKIHHLGGSWKWRYPLMDRRENPSMDDLGVPPCLISLLQAFAADARSPGVRDPPATSANGGQNRSFLSRFNQQACWFLMGHFWHFMEYARTMRTMFGSVFFFRWWSAQGCVPSLTRPYYIGRVSFGGSTYTTQQTI